MADPPSQDTRALSFAPVRYAEIREEGLEAYRTLLEALGPTANGLDLPPASVDVSLRALAWLGGNAAWGELERFYVEPQLAGGETPASEPLRDWYQAYREELDLFFPEFHRMSPLGAQYWDTDFDPRSFWGELQVNTDLFAAESDQRSSGATRLFVLLRDYAEAFGELVEELDLPLDRIARAAFDECRAGSRASRPEGGPERARNLYESLYGEAEIPRGPILAFAAIVRAGESSTAEDLLRRWNDELPIEAIRRAAPAGGPNVELNIQKRATRDLPSREDVLGFSPLVEGLRALLDDEDTSLPLAIGVSAPWGAGKSSVMLQLRKALERPSGNRRWIPVRFDAWKYERSERLWAALAKAIYEQAEESQSLWQWMRFKLRLEIRRRGRRDLVLRLLALVLLLAIGVGGAIVEGLGPTSIAGLSLFTAGVVDTLGRAWGLVADPFKRALDEYTSTPRYEQHLGFTSEADADIRAMTQELTRDPDAALVVFVDDLDRCSPRHIVDVVEAINQIFNSSEEARCAFVLGMDRDMVATGIEVAYGDIVEKLPSERKRNFGLTFLAKLVQISVTIPPPDEDGIERLLTAITTGNGSAGVDSVEVAGMQQRLAREEPSNPAEVHRVAEEIGRGESLSASDRAALEEAVRLERAKLFDHDSEDVRSAERYLIRFLDPNPREIKRFDNAFRLQLHVANGTKGCTLKFDLDDLIVLGKAVVVHLSWPDLAADLDRDEALLGRLEADANDEERPMVRSPWLDDKRLAGLLEDPAPRRLSRLSAYPFLRVS